MTSHTLTDSAFGPDPGRWPLPAAHATGDLWLRAVAAGGQGRYATARADLDELLRRDPAGRFASLALSTHASFLRQTGWHGLARGWDGRAWALSAGNPECAVDALAGLAADALGVGRLSTAATVLCRAVEAHRGCEAPPPRLAIRLAWVHAELAMAAGDGAAARRHADRGVELAAGTVLRRHRIKSDVVLAAALCCAGDLPGSRRIADAALEDTEALGLVPLRWALACLLAGIGSASHSPRAVTDIRDRSATFIDRHGGLLRNG